MYVCGSAGLHLQVGDGVQLRHDLFVRLALLTLHLHQRLVRLLAFRLQTLDLLAQLLLLQFMQTRKAMLRTV